jgi:histidyl-tRNA synthetase
VLKDSEVSASVGGGGRYDELIEAFSGSKEKTPAVGISFGVERILEALGEGDAGASATRVFVIPIGGEEVEKKAFEATRFLREKGVNSEVDLMQRSVSKNLDYASKQGIAFALIVGERELKEKKFTLRDMKSGKEELVSLEKVVELVK